MTLTNLEPDVMQRAWVPHGAQDVGKLYFHQGGGAVVYSLQRAPPETSVRETALPFLRVKLAGTWGRGGNQVASSVDEQPPARQHLKHLLIPTQAHFSSFDSSLQGRGAAYGN